MPLEIKEILKEELNYQKLNDLTNEFVFISKKGNHLSINTINRRIKKTSEKLYGIVITSHSFRHGHITLLAELGILLKSIMDRVGHADVNTTITIYTHTTEKWGRSSCKSSIILINYKKLPHESKTNTIKTVKTLDIKGDYIIMMNMQELIANSFKKYIILNSSIKAF